MNDISTENKEKEVIIIIMALYFTIYNKCIREFWMCVCYSESLLPLFGEWLFAWFSQCHANVCFTTKRVTSLEI